MKRLIWILLAVFCTALAQVQPVDQLARPGRAACKCHGKCGMPDCPAPATQMPSEFLLEGATAVARPARKRAVPPAPKLVEKFFVSIVTPGVRPAVSPAPALPAPAASVPLFKAHCSFLI
jgi:hypothetical protein